MNLSRTGNEQYGNRNQSAGIQAIIKLYAQAYGDSGLTAEEVLEEILCDSIGKMNAFATESTRSLAGEVGVFLRNVRKNVRRQEEGGNQSGTRDGGVVNSREMDPVAALEKQVKLLRQQKEYWKNQSKRTDGKKADSKAVQKLVLQLISNKKAGTAKAVPTILVGVAGFEPAASWTRTMRDTKLRHTPIALIL